MFALRRRGTPPRDTLSVRQVCVGAQQFFALRESYARDLDSSPVGPAEQ
jgi:hypothetical protein